MPSAGGAAVDALAQRDGRQLLVGGLLFIKIGRKQPKNIIVAELLGPGDQRAVAGHLVVLDRLSSADDRGIQNILVGNLASNVVGFRDQSVDRRAPHTFRLVAEFLEYLSKALDLLFGFRQMLLQALAQIAVG